jgi:hypothetical protein
MSIGKIVDDLLFCSYRTSADEVQLARIKRLEIQGLETGTESFVQSRHDVIKGIACNYKGRHLCTVYGNKVVPNLWYMLSREYRKVVKRVEDCCFSQ